MKKFFMLLSFVAITSLVDASTPNEGEKPAKDKKEKVKNDEKKKEASENESCEETSEIFCVVTCSGSANGVEATVTSGNFLTSCESASKRCEERLRYLLALK